jgi:hypothetical protein
LTFVAASFVALVWVTDAAAGVHHLTEQLIEFLP